MAVPDVCTSAARSDDCCFDAGPDVKTQQQQLRRSTAARGFVSVTSRGTSAERALESGARRGDGGGISWGAGPADGKGCRTGVFGTAFVFQLPREVTIFSGKNMVKEIFIDFLFYLNFIQFFAPVVLLISRYFVCKSTND